MSTAERASKASSAEQGNKRAVRSNRRASGPAFTSRFLAVLNHCDTLSTGMTVVGKVCRALMETNNPYMVSIPRASSFSVYLYVSKRKNYVCMDFMELRFLVNEKFACHSSV